MTLQRRYTTTAQVVQSLPQSFDIRRAVLRKRGLTAALAVICCGACLGYLSVLTVGVRLILLTLLPMELIFFLWFKHRYRVLNTQPDKHEPNNHDAMSAFHSLIKVCKAFQNMVDVKVYLSTWFLGAPFAAIKRDNVADLMAYGFWYRTREQMEQEGLGHIPYEMVDQLEEAFDVKIPEGYTPGLRAMYHLWEPLRVVYRPLVFYLFMEFLWVVSWAVMKAYGYRRHRYDSVISYYVYNPETGGTPTQVKHTSGPPSVVPHVSKGASPVRSTVSAPIYSCSGTDPQPLGLSAADSFHMQLPTLAELSFPVATSSGGDAPLATGQCLDPRVDLGSLQNSPSAPWAGQKGLLHQDLPKTPIILLHGVSAGLLPYVELVKCLTATGYPVVALEYKHVGMRLCRYVPTVEDIVTAVVDIMDKEGIKEACFVSHSYGTFVGSRLIKLHRHRVHSTCLIDPVCFGMYMPHLLKNFIYRSPRRNDLRTFIKEGGLAFVSSELHCATAMCRRFYWSDVNLWHDELPPRTLVVLHSRDELIHVHEVHDIVTGHATKIMHHPSYAHAEFLIDFAWQDEIVREIVHFANMGETLRRATLTGPVGPLHYPAVPSRVSITAPGSSDPGRKFSATLHRSYCRKPSYYGPVEMEVDTNLTGAESQGEADGNLETQGSAQGVLDQFVMEAKELIRSNQQLLRVDSPGSVPDLIGTITLKDSNSQEAKTECTLSQQDSLGSTPPLESRAECLHPPSPPDAGGRDPDELYYAMMTRNLQMMMGDARINPPGHEGHRQDQGREEDAIRDGSSLMARKEAADIHPDDIRAVDDQSWWVADKDWVQVG